MSGRTRLFEIGPIYSITQRTNDRCFLFKPNHNPDFPLLAEGCPPWALQMNNDVIPRPSVINIIGSSLVRAMEKHPIDLFCYEVSINHNHDGARPRSKERLGDVAKFFQLSGSLIARQLNKTWQREGRVFGGPYRMEPCIDDHGAEQQLEYALTNAIKDNLIESIERTPFFSTYKSLAQGKPLCYWWIDWAGYWKAGGTFNKDLHPKQFLKWGELKLATLPSWQNFNVHQQQTRARKMAQNARDEAARKRKEEKRTVFGIPALYTLDPRDRPKNPKKSSPQPLCHASDKSLRREFRRKWRDFLSEYKEASADFRNGDWEREFPEGSFRPIIATIYQASRL